MCSDLPKSGSEFNSAPAPPVQQGGALSSVSSLKQENSAGEVRAAKLPRPGPGWSSAVWFTWSTSPTEALWGSRLRKELSVLSPVEMQRFAQEFVMLSFSEDQDGAASYVMGVIHGAASYLPDFLEYFSTKFPNSPVKMEVLGRRTSRRLRWQTSTLR